ncbi:MAG TPA: glycosyltransferase [Acidimicrobiales bacterium]|nr:glycosyltransferase [Acidimicrobiales bacterium]
MRLHVVGLVHTQTTRAYSVCAFTENCRKFARMMTARGHEVYLYAGEHDESGAELVTCITEAEQAALGFTGPETILHVDYLDARQWVGFLARVVAEIRARLEPDDIVCLSMGSPTMDPVTIAFPDHKRVEYTAGYAGVDLRNLHVWPSYAWMHFVSGYRQLDGNGYDAVIPHPVETDDSPVGLHPDDYFMWIGRPARKGRHIAMQVAETLRRRLVVAGPDDDPRYGEYVGIVGPAERGKLLSHATALFVPTEYVGPFELVFAEALMCGTPVITTDWGAFTEYVEQGVDGYRCRTIPEFLDAAMAVGDLDRARIAARARARFSPEVVGAEYEKFLAEALLW